MPLKSTGFYSHSLRHGTVHADRSSALLALARGGRVLHIGCTDYPLTSSRMEGDTLLHADIMSVARSVHGVDIDSEGIGILQAAIGGTYSVCDISTDLPKIAFVPDLVLVADVIEHVADQGAFVAGLARLASLYPDATIAISTPNALAIRTTVNTALGREIIHPDHCLVHSPQTLQTLLATHGLRVDEVRYYNIRSGRTILRNAYDAIPRSASLLRPGFADGMIALARSG